MPSKHHGTDAKDGTVRRHEALRSCSKSQKEVMEKSATAMLGGKMLVLGPAGTGKTTLMINMMLPGIRQHKIFMMAQDNVHLVSLIQKTIDRIQSDRQLHHHTIIVCHHADTLETEAAFGRLNSIREKREAQLQKALKDRNEFYARLKWYSNLLSGSLRGTALHNTNSLFSTASTKQVKRAISW
ncbi:hypothetical protein MMC14_003745 [Varicellaria rhodocarpa]|nr:hypothetical protein [Varicellaria rhodocarpa]